MSQAGALHVRRRRLLLAGLLGCGLVLLGRGFHVQVVQASEWRGRAVQQQRDQVSLPAERGTIYDRNGIPLAATREMVRVSVAPQEVKDPATVRRLLRSVLGLSGADLRRATDPARRWVVLPGRYELTAWADLEGVDGIYLERVMERFHPHGSLALELLGRTAHDGRPLGGLEMELDSLLQGRDGSAILRRDALGDPLPGAPIPLEKPRPGHDVYLTLDLGLQEIAEGALRDAVREHDALGGDLIFADPHTGEVLAAASVRSSGGPHWRGVTDPYEPGSTMKPFVMAALLDRSRVALSDTVFAEEGRYRNGARLITDVHGYGWLTAGEVLRYSSNIGMAKLVERLRPEEQYATLRAFGFGTPTGVAYPSESGGLLRRPAAWSGYSQASIAMGYEVSVTPLQMTMAYGALANGGKLMEPRLIREVRGPGGKVVRRAAPLAIRRTVRPATVAQVAEVLMDVVEEGTGRRAGLGEFMVAGKTGTARVYQEGAYQRGSYTASFAGFFPARDPQLVFLVKLDRGSEYGGSVAAPVTRSTLAAALAARTTALDRGAVAASMAPRPVEAGAAVMPRREPRLPPAHGPFVFLTKAGAPRHVDGGSAPAAVPDVRGESARDAAAALHASGFRVEVIGLGQVTSMQPEAGSVAARGATVRLNLGRSR